jgi:hypothetical protein
MTRQ